MLIRSLLVCAALALLLPEITAAQACANRPIRFIVPSAAGGSPDINSRELANELTKQLGQQVVVENRPGASGIIGYELLARATPDGYTFGYISNFIATNPSLYAKLPYDFARDFRPVVFYFRGVNILTVSPSLPVRSVKELIEHARANPGKLAFGSSGIGATPHLSMELFKTMTNTNIVHVPYKGTQLAVTDVIAGQVDILCDNMASMLPHVRSGRVRALAVTSLKRSTATPELPTLDEAGLPGYEITGWSGMAVPTGTPNTIITRLNTEINKALQSPTVIKGITSRGGQPAGSTPEEFAEHVRKETERIGKLVKAVGIKPQ
ncbi:MAG: tripartite tricarboxylate transporter substrate binding protein [Betaproteobacteria bacterium]|nr:tripartite tricarboxylate transporter substrate binding protein [Betaproteobacteria bacterium]